mgnify:CR=1 FL=1
MTSAILFLSSVKLFLPLILKLPSLIHIGDEIVQTDLHLFVGCLVGMRGGLAPQIIDLRERPVQRTDPLRNRGVKTPLRDEEDHAREYQHQSSDDPEGILGYFLHVAL